MSIVAAYAVPHPPLIVPEVGRGQERAIQATIDAYREVARRIAAHEPDTIVVSSPHAPLFRDCFHLSTGEAAHGDMGRFGAWDAAVNVGYDEEFVAAVAACARKHTVPVCGSGMADAELDHATFVPLHFIGEACQGFRLVRTGLSALSPETHRALGRCIAEAARDLGRRCVFVASGDLSHKLAADGPYGFAPEGPVFDREVTALFDSGDLEGLFAIDAAFADAAAECGLRSFQIMAGALEGLPTTHELLSYEGPFGVGYAVAAFEVEGPQGDGAVNSAVDAEADARAAADAAADEGAVDPYVALARASVEGFVRTGRPIDRPAGLPPELMDERAGVFVSLHEGGDLRGCIGTIAPVTGCVADEIIRNGVAAASEDPRFPPVRERELDALSYSVDVLRPPMPVGSPEELDPARFGVIVTKGWRRGLLLPNLEGVDDVADQLAIAKRKAGIDPADDDVELERFEVVRHARGGEACRG
ncbi:AmmeMemoRadiSam system protein A [Arabiibacter massiliensis]|uniref:AmmeMemoRadiSam system protein A n=1 Tax=Arabiibacter massiliensis TaxID=1870985 RepID=UPI0009BB7B4F|nr:AmmeMemoRadiSam system protein A [Arabiibacter massiliensis]